MTTALRIVRSAAFIDWIRQLRDFKAQAVIERRLERVKGGNFGDVRSVGTGVAELRIDFGPGYRVYFARVSDVIVVLLCGGDKSSQSRDIALAMKMAPRAQEIADASRI